MVSFAHGLGRAGCTVPFGGGPVLAVATDMIDQGNMTDVLLQLATAIAGVVTVIGRIGATSRIL